MTQSIPLIDGQDNFEVIRDKIGQILAAETVAQVALATAASKPNPNDWKFHVYLERINPWEAFRDGDGDLTPIINVWYDNATLQEGASNHSTRQRHKSRFNIDVYAYAPAAETATGHNPGDEATAFLTHRTVRLVRNILMHDKWRWLGLRNEKDFFQHPTARVESRFLNSITVFQPQSGNQPVQRVVAARIALDVEHPEVIDLNDEETLEVINVEFYRGEDDKLIAELKFSLPHVCMTTTKSGTFSSTWKGSGTILVDWGIDGSFEEFELTAGGVVVSHIYPDTSEKTICVHGDIDGVTSLVADSQSISAVDGLYNLTSATFVTFYFNSITDLSGFAGMPVIGEIGLSFNPGLDDIYPLAGLTTLTRLSLHQCNIADLSPLSTLVNLDYLRLYDNAFLDVSPLTSLVALTTLYVYNNTLTYTTLSWPAYSSGTFRFDSAGLSSAEVDQLLIDAAAAGWSSLTFYLDGSNGVRTSASDAAVVTLLGNGVTLYVNE